MCDLLALHRKRVDLVEEHDGRRGCTGLFEHFLDSFFGFTNPFAEELRACTTVIWGFQRQSYWIGIDMHDGHQWYRAEAYTAMGTPGTVQRDTTETQAAHKGDEPLTAIKLREDSVARALAIMVLLQPGGP